MMPSGLRQPPADTCARSHSDLKVGDVVVVSGTPALDPAVHELARIEEVRRVSDGWRWLKNDAGRGAAIIAPR